MEPSNFDSFYFALMRLLCEDFHIKSFFDDLGRKIRNKIYFNGKKSRGRTLKGQNCLIIGMSQTRHVS